MDQKEPAILDRSLYPYVMDELEGFMSTARKTLVTASIIHSSILSDAASFSVSNSSSM